METTFFMPLNQTTSLQWHAVYKKPTCVFDSTPLAIKISWETILQKFLYFQKGNAIEHKALHHCQTKHLSGRFLRFIGFPVGDTKLYHQQKALCKSKFVGLFFDKNRQQLIFPFHFFNSSTEPIQIFFRCICSPYWKWCSPYLVRDKFQSTKFSNHCPNDLFQYFQVSSLSFY